MSMRFRHVATLLGALALFSVAAHAQQDVGALIDRSLAGPQRSAENRARDAYRHPRETLLFFGLKPEMTVVELWPDTGWYAEVLAPVLRERGKYVAAQYPLEHSTTTAGRKAARMTFDAKLKADPVTYGKVVSSDLAAPDRLAMVPPGTADMVLAFRSVHVWAFRGYDDLMFKASFDALKRGGILGVVDHRAPEGTPKQKQVDTGYMTESYVIAAAEKAGFKLGARSEINANARDTKDYGKGVWALPPSYAYGDTDRAKYLAIGESDRLTLRFVKP